MLFRSQDGIDGANPMLFGGYGTIPAEVLEREYPMVVEGFGFVPDSAGAGKHRGALAVYRKWRFLERGHIMVRTNKPSRAAKGLAGGKSGTVSANVFNPDAERRDLPRQSHLHLEVQPGDRLFHATPGSGGYGDPYERAPEQVLADVLEDKISLPAARDAYGVVIDGKSMTVNMAATRELRHNRGL